VSLACWFILLCDAGGLLAADPPPATLPLPLPVLAQDDGWKAGNAKADTASPSSTPAAAPLPPPGAVSPTPAPPSVHAANAADTARLLPIDLPYALHLVNAANPTIALARERVAEAYAAQKQADVLWLPNLWLGANPNAPTFLPTFLHHDGYIQNSSGTVFFTDKNNFFLGAGASLSVSLADAIFAPRFARDLTAAAQARAQAVTNDIQLEVSLAYLDLLHAYGALAINREAIDKTEEMLKAAESAFKNGLGKTGADANRARTEVQLRRQERLVRQEEAARASARLAQLLLLDPCADLLPADQAVLPIALVPLDCCCDDLIATALMNRPELAEDRALIAAALKRWREAKYRPLIPFVQAFYWGGSFMGGNPTINVTNTREDVTAQVGWELRNLGFGDLYRAKEMRSRYNQAQLRLIEEQARVSAEVTVAMKAVRQREQAVREAQVGVRNAEEMWRKLRAIAFGVGLPARQYDPLEPLLAERALVEARTLYLDHVIEYNRNQFRLYWALGQPPECALPGKSQPAEPAVLPPPGGTAAERGKGKDDEKGKADGKAGTTPGTEAR
jgi:outer membrane protein TolC